MLSILRRALPGIFAPTQPVNASDPQTGNPCRTNGAETRHPTIGNAQRVGPHHGAVEAGIIPVNSAREHAVGHGDISNHQTIDRPQSTLIQQLEQPLHTAVRSHESTHSTPRNRVEPAYNIRRYELVHHIMSKRPTIIRLSRDINGRYIRKRPCFFLRLPAELRYLIYDHCESRFCAVMDRALMPLEEARSVGLRSTLCQLYGLSLTCRFLRTEIMDLAPSLTQHLIWHDGMRLRNAAMFQLPLDYPGLANIQAITITRSLVRRCDPASISSSLSLFAKLRHVFVEFDWKNLPRLHWAAGEFEYRTVNDSNRMKMITDLTGKGQGRKWNFILPKKGQAFAVTLEVPFGYRRDGEVVVAEVSTLHLR